MNLDGETLSKSSRRASTFATQSRHRDTPQVVLFLSCLSISPLRLLRSQVQAISIASLFLIHLTKQTLVVVVVVVVPIISNACRLAALLLVLLAIQKLGKLSEPSTWRLLFRSYYSIKFDRSILSLSRDSLTSNWERTWSFRDIFCSSWRSTMFVYF